MITTVSIIIAAYNAEKFLPRCLQSITSQTFQDFEVIIVDDGSTDTTSKIADDYADKDARFRVIHQKNQGVAVARQVGLEHAIGEFTIHADADDWMDPDMLEQMVRCAKDNQADFVFCDFYIVHSGDIIEYRTQTPVSTEPITVMGLMLFDLLASLWNKLIRRSIIVESGICFTPGMNIGEDQIFILKILSHHPRVAYLNQAFYHYDHTQNENSLCNRGVYAKERIIPLEMIASYTDIAPIQTYFDRAVFHIAFEYLYEPKELCPDYPAVFKTHRPSLWRVKGYPIHAKLCVLLRAYGVFLPMNEIKSFWNHLMKHG